MNNEPIAVFIPAPLGFYELKRRFTLHWRGSEPNFITHLYSEDLLRQQQAEIEVYKKALEKLARLGNDIAIEALRKASEK